MWRWHPGRRRIIGSGGVTSSELCFFPKGQWPHKALVPCWCWYPARPRIPEGILGLADELGVQIDADDAGRLGGQEIC